jgi:hypothetical protein
MQKGCNSARSEAFNRINLFTDRYLESGTRPVKCDLTTTRKTSRGLNHPQIGRLIIPVEHVAEWDENTEQYVVLFFTINF